MMASSNELREAAIAYSGLGWRVVPVEIQGKKPSDGIEWQTARYWRTAAQLHAHWLRPFNIGVLLGSESGDLADVDLDCTEALAFADEYLPPGAFVFGRSGAPRSHRLYRASGAHLIQLRDVAMDGRGGQMLVELRAKPPGGAGAQTVLPPSIHKSGERIEWDADAADGQELPSIADASGLTAAVRRVAVAAFLARHLGGVEPARRYLADPRPGLLQPEVAAHGRDLAGLPKARAEAKAKAKASHGAAGDGPLESLRAGGVEAAAALLGLQWDERRRALVVCPGCRRDTRSDHDKRSAAGTFKATDSGVELWTHGKCGATGDAIALVAAEILGTLKPTRDQWRELVADLRSRGLK